MNRDAVFASLGLDKAALSGGTLPVTSPIDGAEITRVAEHATGDVEAAIERAVAAFATWRTVPGPRRGELVRLFGEELRANKEALGRLVTLECGKIFQEGLGEVQEMIDICDFAVGLSRTSSAGAPLPQRAPGATACSETVAPDRPGGRSSPPSTSRSPCGPGTPP